MEVAAPKLSSPTERATSKSASTPGNRTWPSSAPGCLRPPDRGTLGVVTEIVFPDYDAQAVVGMTLPEATAMLAAHGFTEIPAYHAEEEIALTMDLWPTRCRLFQRHGIVVRAITG